MLNLKFEFHESRVEAADMAAEAKRNNMMKERAIQLEYKISRLGKIIRFPSLPFPSPSSKQNPATVCFKGVNQAEDILTKESAKVIICSD